MADAVPPVPPPPPPDDADDDLVAFLDGELQADENQAIESRIASDPAARQNAQTLKKTYDLLDYLPRAEPSPNFASRTLTHIQPAILTTTTTLPQLQSDPGHPTAPVPTLPIGSGLQPVVRASSSLRILVLWSVAAMFAVGVGYLGHLVAMPHLAGFTQAKRTSEEARMLERLPLYFGIDDLEYLRLLSKPDLFGELQPLPKDTRLLAEFDQSSSTDLQTYESLFKQFPQARQEQLRTLDREFFALEDAERTRLQLVLESYAIWLDRMPEAYRKEVLSAPAAADRIEVVYRVKDRLWREALPLPTRDRLRTAEPAEREQVLQQVRELETDRRHEWAIARREYANLPNDRKPWPFDQPDLSKPLDDYLLKVLKPRLTSEETRELDFLKQNATSSAGWFPWMIFGTRIVKLSEAHPSLPEAAPGKFMPTTMKDFVGHPEFSRLKLTNPNAQKRWEKHSSYGKWPDFAEAFLREANDTKTVLRMPLGPCKPDDYTPTIQQFLERTLQPQLDAKERQSLADAEGKWPEHSQKLMQLARKHDLSVPGVSLPGPPSKWKQQYPSFPRTSRNELKP